MIKYCKILMTVTILFLLASCGTIIKCVPLDNVPVKKTVFDLKKLTPDQVNRTPKDAKKVFADRELDLLDNLNEVYAAIAAFNNECR